MQGRFIPNHIIDKLLQMDVFAGLSGSAAEQLIDSIYYARIPEGTEFIKQGAPAEACYFLLDGEIAVKSGDALLMLQKAPIHHWPAVRDRSTGAQRVRRHVR